MNAKELVKKSELYKSPTVKVIFIVPKSIICLSTENYEVNDHGLGDDDFE